MGVKLFVLRAGTEVDIDAGFATLKEKGIGPLVVSNNASFNSERMQFVALVKRHKLPAI